VKFPQVIGHVLRGRAYSSWPFLYRQDVINVLKSESRKQR
jgi:hypothetical protein